MTKYEKLVNDILDDEDDLTSSTHGSLRDISTTTDVTTNNETTNETKGILQLIYDNILYIINFLMFSWLRPLLELGNKQPLEQNDLYNLEKSDQSLYIYLQFKKYWKKQLIKNKPSLLWAVINSFGTPFFLVGFLKLIHDICLFIGPMLLNKIIIFLDDESIPLSTGLFYVFSLFITNVTMSICLRQYFWYVYVHYIYMHIYVLSPTVLYNIFKIII
jgi:hypothetical protein